MKKAIYFASFFILSFLSFNVQAGITYDISEAYGANGGQPFILPEGTAQFDISQITHIQKISLKVSNRIEKIQVTWALRNGEELVQSKGEDNGFWEFIELSQGEYITKVTGKTDRFLNQITFHTNFGQQYGPFGSTLGTPFKISVPQNFEVIGFIGNSGECIQRFALIYKVDDQKINMQPSPVKPPTHHKENQDTSVRPVSSTAQRPTTAKQLPSYLKPINHSNTIDHIKVTSSQTPSTITLSHLKRRMQEIENRTRRPRPSTKKNVVGHRVSTKRTSVMDHPKKTSTRIRSNTNTLSQQRKRQQVIDNRTRRPRPSTKKKIVDHRTSTKRTHVVDYRKVQKKKSKKG